MATVTLNVFKGDDKTWNLVFTDSAGDPINLTGQTIFFTVKTNQTDTDSLALIKKEITSHTDETDGKSRLVLSNTDTDLDAKEYFFDLQLVSSSGTVTTLLPKAGIGKFVVTQDVTRRTT